MSPLASLGKFEEVFQSRGVISGFSETIVVCKIPSLSFASPEERF